MNFLEILATIIFLFVVGSVVGWVIEVFFRRIFTAKKWINPGFMVGPYLPLYGFGTVALYGLSNIDMSGIGLTSDNPWTWVVQILMIGVSMTLIELIAGLIFVKGMGIKLWDYSNRWGNFQGIICPLFSFLWLVVGALYFFLINPYLVPAVSWMGDHPIYYLFAGIILGMMLVDFAYSMHLATKIKAAAKKSRVTVGWEQLKMSIKEKTDARASDFKKKHKWANFALPFNNKQSSDETISEYIKSKFYTEKEKAHDLLLSKKREFLAKKKHKSKDESENNDVK